MRQIEQELETIDQELNSLPMGTLRKQGYRYLHAINGTRKGITKNRAMIKALARKKILEVRKKQIQQHNGEASSSIKELIALLPKMYQELPIEYFYHPSLESFQEGNKESNHFRKEELRYQTNAGIYMRSKSEVIIGNLLEENGLLYDYERKTMFGTYISLPDFTIIKPFSGERVIWEHFGALQQDGYEQRMHEKMLKYYEQGLAPFKDLIYTFEFDIAYPKRVRGIVESLLL